MKEQEVEPLFEHSFNWLTSRLTELWWSGASCQPLPPPHSYKVHFVKVLQELGGRFLARRIERLKEGRKGFLKSLKCPFPVLRVCSMNPLLFTLLTLTGGHFSVLSQSQWIYFKIINLTASKNSIVIKWLYSPSSYYKLQETDPHETLPLSSRQIIVVILS